MNDIQERIQQIVQLAEELGDVFECTTPGRGTWPGAPGYPHCAACCYGTLIQASCQEEFDFAEALRDLVVKGHRYMNMGNEVSA